MSKIFHFIFKLFFEGYFKYLYKFFRKKYNIDNTFKFNGIFINFYGEGNIIIGNNSYIGNYSTIQSVNGCFVKIGNNCSISHNVRIYTSNRDPDDIINNNAYVKTRNGNVLIGNNVWIGANVFINQGISIGDNVVIGANSVVTKNLESNSVYAGAPARKIK